MAIELGRYGAWLPERMWRPELAAELEGLGYGAAWVGASPPADLATVEALLDVTSAIRVGTSIVNIWKDGAPAVAESFHRIQARHPDRFVLGVGVGHPEATARYTAPYDAVAAYLDDLDAAGVPAARRVLAALGPRMLRLAAARAAGAIPYLTTPAHTARAREILGPDALLAPEHKVVLSTDDARARALGRARVANPYLGLTNYLNNLRSLGYSQADLADGGSDRLVDDLALHGAAAEVAEGLEAHHRAGADHVAIQVLDDDLAAGYRALAGVLRLERTPAHSMLDAVRTTRVSRHVNAPRTRVYHALIDAAAVARWKVPARMTCHVHSFDGREGGTFRISLSYAAPDQIGKTERHTDTYHGRFVRLVPDELVVEVDEFETTDPQFRGEMTIIITLADAAGGTDLVAVHDGLPSGVSLADNETGWREALDRLAALVETDAEPR